MMMGVALVLMLVLVSVWIVQGQTGCCGRVVLLVIRMMRMVS